MQHLFDGCPNIFGIIDDLQILQIRREINGCFLQDLLDVTDCIHGIRIIGELNTEADTIYTIRFRND